MASLVLGAVGMFAGGAAATAMGFAAGTFGAAALGAAGWYAGPAIGHLVDPEHNAGQAVRDNDSENGR